MLGIYHLNTTAVDATLFHLESCFASQKILLKNVTRKLYFDNLSSTFVTNICQCSILRFDGVNFKKETSSLFEHLDVWSLGNYQDSPFVTGHHSSTDGLKTEILDYESAEWTQAADYPFSNGDRFCGFSTVT